MHENRLHHGRAGGRRARSETLQLPRRRRADAAARRVRGRDGAPADVRAVRRRDLHARPQGLRPRSIAADQAAAYRALRKGIMDYERRQVYRGPEAYVDLPADRPRSSTTRIDEALADHPDNDDLLAAVVLKADAEGGRRGARQRRRRCTITGEGLQPAQSGPVGQGAARTSQIRRGAVIRVVEGAQGRLGDHPAARGRRRLRRARPARRRDPRAGRRLRLRQEQVQPRDAGLAPAGLELQALHLLGRAGEGLHAGDRRQRRAAVLRRRRHRQPAVGAEELRRQVRGADALRTALAKSKNMVSIRILQAIGPRYAQDWITRFGFDPEKHPAYLHDGARRRLGHAAADGGAPTACSPTAATASTRMLITRITDTKGKVLVESRAAGARRIDARASTQRNAFMMDSLLQEVTRSAPPPARRPRSSAPTSPARPAPPTTRSTPGSPASSRRWSASPGSATTRRASSATARPAAAWRCRSGSSYMEHALKGVPVPSCRRRPKAWSTSAASGTTTTTRRAAASPAWAWTPADAAGRSDRGRAGQRDAAAGRAQAHPRSVQALTGVSQAANAAAWPACALALRATARRRTRRPSRCRPSAPPSYRKW